MEQAMPYEDWYKELQRIAASHGLSWVVGRPEHHRAAYEHRDSPQEEFEYQVECAQ